MIGTVRDPNDRRKTGYLQAIASKLPGKLEFVKADLLQEGSFDAAVKGCVHVYHCASPFLRNVESEGIDAVNERLIAPAVQGTTNVMNAVAKAKDTVKCVALTASCASISGFQPTDKPVNGISYTEEDWNTSSTRTKGAYLLSKVMAEKAAWDIAKKESIKLCVINPSFVIGPSPIDRNDGVSIEFGINLLKTGKITLGGFPCIVEVTDFSIASVKLCCQPCQVHGKVCVTS